MVSGTPDPSAKTRDENIEQIDWTKRLSEACFESRMIDCVLPELVEPRGGTLFHSTMCE